MAFIDQRFVLLNRFWEKYRCNLLLNNLKIKIAIYIVKLKYI